MFGSSYTNKAGLGSNYHRQELKIGLKYDG